MASLSIDKQGNRRIQFYDGADVRKSVPLGKLSKKAADAIRTKIEALNAAKIAGTAWDNETALWVAELEPSLYEKLAAVELAPPRAKIEQLNLESFLDAYIARRSDVKSSTAIVYVHTRRCLIEYFGATKPLIDITPGDADDFRRWLSTHQKLSDSTVRRRCSIARQFFRDALRRRMILENPFADMKGIGVRANRARDYHLSRADAAKVLDACPDAQWKLLFALSRFGGLRCPSEHLALRWSDVDWKRGRLTIHSAKTERHEGKDVRVIPLFPELRPHLEAVWAESSPDSKYVITRYRHSNANLRTQLARIIKRAGLKPWPKLFQNLRSTRETELAQDYPLHVVCEWIGNSVAVAAKHYLQVTDADFERAQFCAPDAVQSAAHRVVPSGFEPLGERADCENARNGVIFDSLVGGTRLELVTSTV